MWRQSGFDEEPQLPYQEGERHNESSDDGALDVEHELSGHLVVEQLHVFGVYVQGVGAHGRGQPCKEPVRREFRRYGSEYHLQHHSLHCKQNDEEQGKDQSYADKYLPEFIEVFPECHLRAVVGSLSAHIYSDPKLLFGVGSSCGFLGFGLVVILLDRLVDGILELLDAAAGATHQFGEFLASEKQQQNHDDKQNFARAQSSDEKLFHSGTFLVLKY